MGQECPFLQRLVELAVVRAGGIIATHAVLDVLSDRLDCGAARRFALCPTADPSATIIKKASRSGSAETLWSSGRLVWRTTSCFFRAQMRKWSWFSLRTLPGWVRP
jgi:hypothetical protein